MPDGRRAEAVARLSDYPGRLGPTFMLFASLLAAGTPSVRAQEPSLDEAVQQVTRSVPAATRDYSASGFNRWLRGADYRELWQTPVEAPLLDLERLGGGLTPVFALGEGRGLALRGANGLSYTFRALDKDLARTLPESWYYTLPADLLQDQTVADHPAANLIVPELARALGILRPATRLVVMPESSRLGEFAASFAGVLGTIEFYPTSSSGFHGAEEIISTETLWDRVRAGAARADALALLRTRLLDMLVGDWDRHHEQFRWARLPGRARWQPIPEDHDHAFVSYEGLALALARTRVPRLVRFTDRIEPIDGLNEKGLEVDSWILSELGEEDFVRTADEIVATLDDAQIERALGAMPAEYRENSGAQLTERLKRRRDDLPRAARAYYRQLARQVDVWATDGDDRVEVTHQVSRTRVRIVNASGDTWFDRSFAIVESERIRIYLGGGTDRLVESGPGGVPVAVVSGPGPDWIQAGSSATQVFDLEDDDVVGGAAGVRTRRLADHPETPIDAPPWERPTDRGSSRYPTLWTSVEPDASLFLGGGMVWTHHRLRAYPYAERHRVRFGFAFGRSVPRFEYDATFRPAQSRTFYRVGLQANGLARLNFYGFGNETRAEEPSDDFFEATGQEIRIGATLGADVDAHGVWSAGAAIVRFGDSDDPNTLLSRERPYGSGGFWSTRLSGEWHVDTRGPARTHDEEGWRTREFRTGIRFRGVHAGARLDLTPPLMDATGWYVGAQGFVTGYLPVAPRVTLAARAGGRHVWGEFPWQAAAYIGGDESVRGYRPQRFAGRSSLYGNLEARVGLGRAVIVVPGELGLFVHTDMGRVWADGERSARWHPAVGGGVYFVLPELENTFHLGVAAGGDGPLLHLGAGFGF